MKTTAATNGKLQMHTHTKVLANNLLPSFSFAWYNGHSTTRGEGRSPPCQSLEVYGNLGGKDYGIPGTRLMDSQTSPSFACKSIQSSVQINTTSFNGQSPHSSVFFWRNLSAHVEQFSTIQNLAATPRIVQQSKTRDRKQGRRVSR